MSLIYGLANLSFLISYTGGFYCSRGYEVHKKILMISCWLLIQNLEHATSKNVHSCSPALASGRMAVFGMRSSIKSCPSKADDQRPIDAEPKCQLLPMCTSTHNATGNSPSSSSSSPSSAGLRDLARRETGDGGQRGGVKRVCNA